MPMPADRIRPDAPPSLVEAARDYIARTTWTFAKTMPTNPHWYCVRQKARAAGLGAGHEQLFTLIRDYHYSRRWHGRRYRSIDLDGYSYWIIEDGTVINRKPADDAGWDDEPQPFLW